MKPNSDSICVLHFPNVDSSELHDLREELHSVSDKVELRQRRPEPQASIDWAFPAIVEVWLPSAFIVGYLATLGGKAADATTKAIAALYQRIKRRTKWQTPSGRGRLGPVISIELAGALPAEEADVVFTFPPGMSQQQFRTALSRLPALVRRQRNSGRRYFESPGTVRGYVNRTVRFYYERSSHRWRRVWPLIPARPV